MRARSILAVLLGLHVAWCVLRIPHAVIGKRVREVHELEERGAARYLLERNELSGVEFIEALRRDTPERCVILFAGEAKGVLEFAPALLWPRLLADENALRGQHSLRGLPFARGRVGDLEGEIVLRATRTTLALELRR